MNDDDDNFHTNIGDLLRKHRERLGLTWYALAGRTTRLDSGYIKQVEFGIRPGLGRRSVALALARALELDPWETDHFLYVAGHAPLLDWQQVARDLHGLPRLWKTFKDLTAPYYQELGEYDTPEEEPSATTGKPATAEHRS